MNQYTSHSKPISNYREKFLTGAMCLMLSFGAKVYLQYEKSKAQPNELKNIRQNELYTPPPSDIRNESIDTFLETGADDVLLAQNKKTTPYLLYTNGFGNYKN